MLHHKLTHLAIIAAIGAALLAPAMAKADAIHGINNEAGIALNSGSR